MNFKKVDGKVQPKKEHNSYIQILIFHWIIGGNTIWYWSDYNLCMLAKKTWQSSDVNNISLYERAIKIVNHFLFYQNWYLRERNQHRNTLNWIKWILNIFWLHYPNLYDTFQLFFFTGWKQSFYAMLNLILI